MQSSTRQPPRGHKVPQKGRISRDEAAELVFLIEDKYDKHKAALYNPFSPEHNMKYGDAAVALQKFIDGLIQ